MFRGVEDVDDMMSDLQEQLEVANEISDAISNSTGFGQDLDEVSMNDHYLSPRFRNLEVHMFDIGPNFIALLTINKDTVLAVAGNYGLTCMPNVFHWLAGKFVHVHTSRYKAFLAYTASEEILRLSHNMRMVIVSA